MHDDGWLLQPVVCRCKYRGVAVTAGRQLVCSCLFFSHWLHEMIQEMHICYKRCSDWLSIGCSSQTMVLSRIPQSLSIRGCLIAMRMLAVLSWAVGDTGVLCGLETRPDLNHQLVTITQAVVTGKSGPRVGVRLASTGATLAVRPGCLQDGLFTSRASRLSVLGASRIPPSLP